MASKLFTWLTGWRIALRDRMRALSLKNGKRNVGRVLQLAEKRLPDRDRWSDPASYNDHWDNRAVQASRLIPDGCRVLEIGVGKGAFRDLVKGRCRYVGADLNPLDPESLVIDIDSEPLPAGEFDYIVLLGVLEYLHNFDAVVEKLRRGAPGLLISYSIAPTKPVTKSVLKSRLKHGWVNHLTVAEIRDQIGAAPFKLTIEEPYKVPGIVTEQRIFRFDRA